MTWLVLSILGFMQMDATAPPSCVRNYGKLACGFHCLAAHGELACARTREGVCGATSTGVVCWDPPETVRAHYGARTPLASCMTRSGNTRCGYRCAAHDEEVRCASTPDGICRATALGVTCWDPPPTAYCADDRPLPRPQCVVIDDVATCGYACEARFGNAACAQTPGGICQVASQDVVCWDPDGPPMCGALPCGPEPTGRPWCVPPPPRDKR